MRAPRATGGRCVNTGRVFRPRRAVQSGADGRAHQDMVAGMKLDLVDAVPEAVVAAQLRRVHIGEPRMVLHFRAAQAGTEFAQRRTVQGRRVEVQA